MGWAPHSRGKPRGRKLVDSCRRSLHFHFIPGETRGHAAGVKIPPPLTFFCRSHTRRGGQKQFCHSTSALDTHCSGEKRSFRSRIIPRSCALPGGTPPPLSLSLERDSTAKALCVNPASSSGGAWCFSSQHPRVAPSLPRVLPLCVQARVDSSAGARLCAAESLRIVGYRSRSSPTASFGRGDGKREDGQRFFSTAS